MKLYIQGEHGKLLTFTPEEIKEKLGIPFDIAALGIEVDDGDATIRAQSYAEWVTRMETRPSTSASMKCRLAHWLCRRSMFRLPSFIFMMNRGRMNLTGLHVPALRPVHLVTKVLTSSSVT